MQRKKGRSFEDSDDEEFRQEKDQMMILLGKFDNLEFVLENAALTSAFLNYIFSKSHDYFALLYIYVFRKYVKVNEMKNSMRNYNHINMEIYTTFVHPQSVLSFEFRNEEVIKKIEETMDTEDCIVYFNKISEFIIQKILPNHLEQFQETIRLGLESFSYTNKLHVDMNRTKELKVLESLQSSIISTLSRNLKNRCLNSPRADSKSPQSFDDFQFKAICLSLYTQYEYFISSKKYSYTLKHPENMIPNKTFLSFSQVKSMTKQKIKGHYFDDYSLSKVASCLVCEVIIWGPHPSCLYCQNCKRAIHRECKDNVKSCISDVKHIRKNDSIEPEVKTMKSNIDLSKVTVDDRSLGSALHERCQSQNQIFFNSEIEVNTTATHFLKKKPTRKSSISKLQEWKAGFINDNSKKRGVKYTKSMNSTIDAKPFDIDTVARSKSARSRSPNNNDSTTINRFQKRSSSEEATLRNFVEPLKLSAIDKDTEMNVLETFEADIEFKLFPNALKKTDANSKCEYQRLLVLMEFHHKTRFIRMTLKRIMYVLVDPWVKMGEHLELFESFSINCIEKLYTLIGTLVNVIDLCKNESSYDVTMAQNVLNWLSAEDESNLQTWLKLSTDLCCTNILHSIKASWIEHKQMSPKLNALFSVEINRLLVIDQLSNMRSLLFNLPMIVTKIVKDLKRISIFKDEAKIWELVGNKLSRLPQLIDERCMPVVHLINNGTIINSTLKFKPSKNETENNTNMEMYINNFPKTIFKNNFIDFQFVKISNLRELRQTDLKTTFSSIYVRDEVEAAVICYDREIIILQKDGDKYLLKQFKSPGANKLFPVIPLDQIHATKQTGKDNKDFQHELTVLLINQAILVQILFKTENSRDMWFDHISKKSNKVHKDLNSKYNQSPGLIQPLKSNNSEDESEKMFTQSSDDLNLQRISVRMHELNTSLKESVNQFQSTFNIISNEISSNENQECVLKRIATDGPNSPGEFMFGYMNSLKDYLLLGYQMMNQSQSIDSSLLIQKDIIKMNVSMIKSITDRLTSLVQSQEEVMEDSSDESVLDAENNNGPHQANHQDIETFIEDIIAESLNKIDYL